MLSVRTLLGDQYVCPSVCLFNHLSFHLSFRDYILPSIGPYFTDIVPLVKVCAVTLNSKVDLKKRTNVKVVLDYMYLKSLSRSTFFYNPALDAHSFLLCQSRSDYSIYYLILKLSSIYAFCNYLLFKFYAI